MLPDYSRQLLLKEVGARGQAALARSRVLIVGAGGLGSPVLQYLAGAGVGVLGVIDADILHASNLHRQPIYALSQVGEGKAALAAAAVARLNPGVRVETHAERFSADNALALVRAHDVVVDCSDNFRAKFLINDAAVLAERPAVFASVYQYEGQLQVYKPASTHACLRCLWPEATADGVVGNCAQAGVLGPVPGAFGCMQALLTLKILLAMKGQLEGELLLLDFTGFTSTKLKAARRAECAAPRCALIHGLAPEETGIEIALDSLEAAAQRGYQLIDVRTPEEFAAHPTIARHIPMAPLLAEPQGLAPGSTYLLICASGKRSLSAARELRRRGLRVRSLAGGLQALER
ncbi:MAG TPA: HesA/MoeB/ThiF family protein [Steroidobacteraceae bacterium]|nr:HesA/MoeB/ThiF family protein [Steroidobacteraceae bacterium]